MSYAGRIIQDIAEREEQLSTHPHSGQIEEMLKPKGEYRYLVEGQYKIVYKLEEAEVVIHRVFDTRQDPGKMKIKP